MFLFCSKEVEAVLFTGQESSSDPVRPFMYCARVRATCPTRVRRPRVPAQTENIVRFALSFSSPSDTLRAIRPYFWQTPWQRQYRWHTLSQGVHCSQPRSGYLRSHLRTKRNIPARFPVAVRRCPNGTLLAVYLEKDVPDPRTVFHLAHRNIPCNSA